jgi:hypothetical protein
VSKHGDHKDFIDSFLVDASLLAQEGDGILFHGIVNQEETLFVSNFLNSTLAYIVGSSSNLIKLSSQSSPSFDAAIGFSDMVANASKIVSIPCKNELAISCEKKTTLFLPLNLVLFGQICKMDESKSMKNEKWTKNCFNAWRASIGYDTHRSPS